MYLKKVINRYLIVIQNSLMCSCLDIIRKYFINQVNSTSTSNSNTRQNSKNTQDKLKNYTLIRIIGQGSSGKVILVKNNANNVMYAMKILRKSFISNFINLEKIKKESSVYQERNVLQGCDHPFIVKFQESFQNSRKLFFVLEYCPGFDLHQRIRNQALTENETLFYASQILLALEYLHLKKIIYRDLKPSNILIDNRGYIRLVDFGTSLFLEESQYLNFEGTKEYMAPETLLHNKQSRMVDIWAFGIILYELVMGKTPFYDVNEYQIYDNIIQQEVNFPENISQNLQDLLYQILQKDPRKRIGYKNGMKDLKTHPWMKTCDWDTIYEKKVVFDMWIPDQQDDTQFQDICRVIDLIQETLSLYSKRDSSSQSQKTFFNFTQNKGSIYKQS